MFFRMIIFTEAFDDRVRRRFQMESSGAGVMCFHLPQETGDFSHHVAKLAAFIARLRFPGIPMHWIAHP